MRILVVEDDETACVFTLNDRSVKLRPATRWTPPRHGAVGLGTRCKSNHYDLLITDNSMPKVTGIELLKKIHTANLALPVIMATGISPRGGIYPLSPDSSPPPCCSSPIPWRSFWER